MSSNILTGIECDPRTVDALLSMGSGAELYRAAFEQLAAQHPRRFLRIDATRPAIVVSRDVAKVIVQRLPAPAPASPHARSAGGFESSPYGSAPVG